LKPQGKVSVEIIIPIKDQVNLLKKCIESINENTSWEDVRITIVDHESEEKETLDYLAGIHAQTKFKTKIIGYKGEYNFAAINNKAAKESSADYFLFMNNDTQVISSGWVAGLLAWAQLENIGCVGPKLLYPDRSIQHAGVVLGVGGVANHAYYRMPDKTDFYFNHLHSTRNYLAMTAACVLISKEKFNEVGGFNEDLPESYNDVDLCLKLYEKGYRHVYVPFIEVIHFESKSRDPRVRPQEDEYMYKKWSKYIKNDPFYNPNLSKDPTKAPIFSL